MTNLVGQQLGHYQLLRLLGEGGFAEVYLGEHIHLGTQAAIKVLHTQLANDDISTFRTEARTIARLIHPHIVRVLDFGIEGKAPFLVMDYAPNGTLRHRHPKGVALPIPIIVSYVKQVADALQYAHDDKLIHRDIKPENILLGRRNEILLSDFGIAMATQSSRYQSVQAMAGTMAYIAPEQIQGKPRPASDQYALGIVVYEWLTGDRPFHGSLNELIGQHLSTRPPSLQEKLPTIPATVEQVVMTALAKDAKERFFSVQAFASALEQAASQNTPSITRPLEIKSHILPIDYVINVDAPNQLQKTVEAHALSSEEEEAPVSTVIQFSQLLQPPEVVSSSPFPPIETYSNVHESRPLTTGKSIPLPESKNSKTVFRYRIRPSIGKAALVFGLVLLASMSIMTSASSFSVKQIWINRANVKYATATALAAANSYATATATTLVASVDSATTASYNPYPPYEGMLAFDDPLDGSSLKLGGQNTTLINKGSSQYTGGMLHLVALHKIAIHVQDQADNFSNFVYQVRMVFIKGFGGGFTFRGTRTSFYDFRISSDGSYVLVLDTNLFNSNGAKILSQGFSAAIKTGLNQSNLIAAVANGSSIDLYVNLQHIASIKDATYSQGLIGLISTTGSDAVGSSEVAFSNAKVWTL